jgi:hypothetical protein
MQSLLEEVGARIFGGKFFQPGLGGVYVYLDTERSDA